MAKAVKAAVVLVVAVVPGATRTTAPSLGAASFLTQNPSEKVRGDPLYHHLLWCSASCDRGFAPFGVLQNSADILDSVGSGCRRPRLGSSAALARPSPQALISSMTCKSICWLKPPGGRRSVVLTAPRLTFFNGQRLGWHCSDKKPALVWCLLRVPRPVLSAHHWPGVFGHHA